MSNHCDTPCMCRYNILCTIQIIYLFAAACVSYLCSFSTGRRHASPTWFTLYTASTTALIDLPMELIYCTRKDTHFASSRTSVDHKWTDQIYFPSVRWLSNVFPSDLTRVIYFFFRWKNTKNIKDFMDILNTFRVRVFVEYL